jgi:hypothetical protein
MKVHLVKKQTVEEYARRNAQSRAPGKLKRTYLYAGLGPMQNIQNCVKSKDSILLVSIKQNKHGNTTIQGDKKPKPVQRVLQPAGRNCND